MKQLLQNLRDGKAEVVEVPVPKPQPLTALVQTASSLVSAGTERMVVDFAAKNLVGKAAARPDLVRQLLDKARREGVLTTFEAARTRLEQPMALGYSSAGTIIAIGDGLTGFQVGDRVACAGGGYAVHAEYAVVPQNLMALMPESVDFESAAFATVGAIALHGFRLAETQLGEKVAIIGLGLLGLLTVGIARAAGCAVFGVDLDPQRVALARQMGAAAGVRSDAESAGAAFSLGKGFDAILICADTPSNDPVELAGQLSRDRGRVVAVGAVGMEIHRKLYFEKELSFKVSRSYGPGRYDPSYEAKGQDYPYGYVRWTEGRNLQAFIDLLASSRLDVTPLITHRFPIETAVQAYDLISAKSRTPSLGVLITYPRQRPAPAATLIANPTLSTPTTAVSTDLTLAVLGAGNYASSVFLPVIRKVGGVNRFAIISAAGLTARQASQRFGFAHAGSSDLEALEEPGINLVAILTRHE
ncbi:MAG: zinc-binding dehydrogenase, partial [Anaerolineaceae bacterium]|nr:zinc-binding dehydrogenase [Anaerolineaceae bacterium]